MSDSSQSHRLRHTRLPCPSLSPRIWSSSCPLSQWFQPTISSSAIPCPPAFSLSQHQGLFLSSGQIKWGCVFKTELCVDTLRPMSVSALIITMMLVSKGLLTLPPQAFAPAVPAAWNAIYCHYRSHLLQMPAPWMSLFYVPKVPAILCPTVHQSSMSLEQLFLCCIPL